MSDDPICKPTTAYVLTASLFVFVDFLILWVAYARDPSVPPSATALWVWLAVKFVTMIQIWIRK